ncbi:EscU/YscU/HrcU family type III secretion system export apparatus switch protein [Parasulfitobacter algicola]|uniref:Flagellar biosynthesis protein FlhB n=1 Tax=Parasulfitobacter algicola TaxID=2614809 RepID=A0ABX2IW82_9RHOB|nr:flagellar type III secretion system protein FlhB [Sulfitobacter algicola]NSX54669.1 flagellar biosynthesis protein FlhB [Sulfitobacter algicola]
MEEDEDKQHEPTQKKLDDARKKGEVPRSADLTTAASYAGLLTAFMVLGAWSVQTGGTALMPFLQNADGLEQLFFSGHGVTVTAGMMWDLFTAIAPWFLVPAVFALGAIIAQRSFVVSSDKIKPKLSKISLISNAKNKFGRNGLFEFAKSFVKLIMISIILGVFLWIKLPQIIQSLSLSPGMISAVLAELCLQFLTIVLFVAGAIGVVDFFWQYHEHLRKNRMSHKELKDEAKDSEGDPHMKQERRQRGYDIAMNQMLADVPDADVIIVNPQHYAVALKWDKFQNAAPVCVAKGVDEIAARIREVANENGVPIHRDPPTARSLYATVDIGQEVPPETYEVVAAAIRFAESMRLKARKNGWGK